MNLDACEKFINRLPVKDRDSHITVPFIFKFNQKKLHIEAQRQVDAGKPIRLVINKARRVTASSWTEAMLFCHAISLPGSHSLIVAHEFKTSKELFRVPRDFVSAVPFLNIQVIERQLKFPHPTQDAVMQIITAGKDTSGRGFTLSALHASEAAHWVSPDAFMSLLPALSNHKNTIGVIESTPNGSEGEGEMFHDMYWDAVEGKSDWGAIFLSWTDDPACVAPEEFAKDAPADEEEKELLARGFSKGQLAWRRLKINSPECSGNIDTFHQEYPCLCAGTLVSNSHDGIIPIEQAQNSVGNFSDGIDEIINWQKNPIIETFKLTTKYGRILRGTGHHPVASPSGDFIRLRDLLPSQKIALRPPVFALEDHPFTFYPIPDVSVEFVLDKHWARFLGYYMGDGSWYAGTLSLCGEGKDVDIANDCQGLVEHCFGNHAELRQVRGGFEVRRHIPDLRFLFESLELIKRGEHGPWTRRVHVPSVIMRSNRECVREFLRGLFESDGSASANIVRCSSQFLMFMREVQLLLLGFGINAEIRTERRFAAGKEFICYALYMYREAASLFHERIGFIGSRKRNSFKLSSKIGRPPKKHELIDYVVSVEPSGEECTYDLTVAPSHIFGANGILTHNTTAEESFIASGRPAFTGEEVRWAKKNVREPKVRGFLEKSIEGEWKFKQHYKGDLSIWEEPIPGHYYYGGMDAARGIEGRDFSAMVVWDGNTGHQVARYSAYCIPELFATYGASIGRRYNKAMLNPELTGGYGYTVLSMLRDGLKYPNIYFWKGKDDKIAGSKSRMTFGFETTGHMRTVLFEQLRVALREGSGTDGQHGIMIFDEALASQIERCTIKDVRPEVEQGHDDILFGAMLGNIARHQYAPPRSLNPSRPQEDEDMSEAIKSIRGRGDAIAYEPADAMREHFAMISRLIDNPPDEDEEVA